PAKYPGFPRMSVPMPGSWATSGIWLYLIFHPAPGVLLLPATMTGQVYTALLPGLNTAEPSCCLAVHFRSALVRIRETKFSQSGKRTIRKGLKAAVKHGIFCDSHLLKGKFQEKLAFVENTWKEVYPGVGLDYWFVSDEFGRMYKVEKRIAALSQNFPGLAILITCIGLLDWRRSFASNVPK